MEKIRIGSLSTTKGIEYVSSLQGIQAHSVEALAREIARFLNMHCSVLLSLQRRSAEGVKSLFDLNPVRNPLLFRGEKTRPLNIEEQQLFTQHLIATLYPLA